MAKYIVGEIKRNVKSLVAQKIRYHNTGEIGAELQREFDKSNERIGKIKDPFEFEQPIRNPETQRNPIISLKLWYDMVDTNKPWDHKWQLVQDDRFNKNSKITVHRPTQKGVPSESHYHKYKKYDYFYDVWSNIHYGYVGLSVGFDKNTLLLGSNTQQFFQSFLKTDTPDDITTMKIGFELHKKFGKYAEKLKPQDILDILDILDKTPQSKFPTSKKTHICHDKTAQRCKK